MNKKEESPIQGIIDKMFSVIDKTNVKTKNLSEIIKVAIEMREGLLEPGCLPENDWWVKKGIRDFTEVIVRANFKAHSILNPGLITDNLDQQITEALNEIEKRII